MLDLIRGGFYSEPKHEIITRIRARLAKGEKALLIVPEQQTLLAEREMADLLPENAPLLFEVTNFSRLADIIFRIAGGVGVRYLDRVGRSLFMWRTLSELSPLLHDSKGASPAGGDVARALGDLSELQGLSLTASDLIAASEQVKDRDERLSQKLADLSLILATYRARLGEEYSDGGEDLAAALEKLSEMPDIFTDTDIFLDGFTSFTTPQLRLLALLLRRTRVTVSLLLPKREEDAFEYTELRDTAERLLSLAAHDGIERRLFKIDGSSTVNSDLLIELLPLLWKKSTDYKNIYLHSDGHLRIYKGKSPKETADFIAADIRKKIRLGARYSDFAVVARDATVYAGILDTALTEAGIPVFFSRKKDLCAAEATELIESAYAVLLGGYRREDVIRYAKCAFSGITRDEADELELYCETWQIHGKRFTDGIMWNMNPDGYTNRKDPSADALLRRLHSARERLLAPLTVFAEDIAGSHSVGEHAKALFRFLSSLSLEKELAARGQELLQAGETDAAEECARLFEILCSLLDTLVEILGDLTVDAGTFAALLRLLFSSVDIGHIPASLDEVTVGSADMLRSSVKKTVYLFGVNEGEFPATPAAISCFSDRERGLLSSLGYPLPPEDEIRCARELFFFSRALATASEEVVLLTNERDAAFAPLSPAEVIAHIESLTHGEIATVDIASLPLSERVEAPCAALLTLADTDPDADAVREALCRVGLGDAVRTADAPLLNSSLTLKAHTAASLYKKDLALTQSRIENYLSCPLSHFCEYVLHLGGDRRAAFDAMNIGSFLHAILESFFRSLQAEGKNAGDLPPEEKRERIRRGAEQYLADLRAGSSESPIREELLIERLIRSAFVIVEGLCDELRDCRFVPRFFELPIADKKEGLPAPIRIPCEDGTEVKLYGTIDRVDTYTNGEDVYVRVIDYKTGSKDFSPEDLAEGHNLQMFLYLRSITESEDPIFRRSIGVGENGRMIPAAVIYVHAKPTGNALTSPREDAHASVKKEQKRSGMLLSDEVSLAAMNPDYLPTTRNKDGEFKKPELIYTEERWQRISSVLEDGVRQVVYRMKSGDISALPLKRKGNKSVCESCRFKPVCRNASTD